jgi:hypothetical protein
MEVQENEEEFRRKFLLQDTKHKGQRPRLFCNLGIWPSTVILGYFAPSELIELSRVNREAHYICKKVFATTKVDLDRINLRLVKFFARVEQIRITQDSLSFFQTYKENLFTEILTHYKNCHKLIISLNHIFDQRKVLDLLSTLSKFSLPSTLTTLQIEDGFLCPDT